MNNFDFNQKISSQLAFILILILGFLVISKVASVGNEIVKNASNSEIVNPIKNASK